MKATKTFIVLLFYFLTLVTPGLCQNSELDSLKKMLIQHVQHDSLRVDLLNTLAFKSYGIDQKQLKSYADEAKILAKSIGNIKGQARSEYSLSIYYLSQGNLDSALTTAKESLRLFEKIKNTNGILSCCDVLGTICRFKEDFTASESYYKKALEVAKNVNSQRKVAQITFNMATVIAQKSDFERAVKLLKESIAIFDSLGERKRTFGPISSIALIYSGQGRYTESLEYFQQCLSGFRQQKNKISIATTLLNMGSVYSALEEHDKALPLIKEAIQINKELGNEQANIKNYSELGLIYQAKNELGRALTYYNKGLGLALKENNEEGKFICYTNMAGLYTDKKEHKLALINMKKGLAASLALGGKKEIGESYAAIGEAFFNLNDLEKALEHALRGKKIADELSLLKTQKDVNLLLSKIYQTKKEYDKSLASFQLYKSQSDSLFNKKSIVKRTQLEYEYKYKQALDSASIRELQLTKTVVATSKDLEKSQRNYLWAIIGFLLVSILLGSLVFYQKMKNAKSKTLNAVVEQKLLRSQMTPHFIFNSLSVIQGMILNKEEEKSVSYLSKFSKLLRIILENSRDKTVLLTQELAAIENYLALHNLENEAYQYSISVDQSIDETLLEVPPMLIQPFVENAIEHAFVDQEENRRIDVQLNLVNEELVCKIIDNGIGVNAQKEIKKGGKKSLATLITTERLKVLSKDFKMKASVSIEDRKQYGESGTIVVLIIPYKIPVA